MSPVAPCEASHDARRAVVGPNQVLVMGPSGRAQFRTGSRGRTGRGRPLGEARMASESMFVHESGELLHAEIDVLAVELEHATGTSTGART